MIESIDLGSPNIIAYNIVNELTADDVDRIHDDLRAAISAHETVYLYTDVTALEDLEPRAVIKDLKMTPEYVSDIDRYAIVGDERWHEWLSRAGDVLTGGEVRYFSPEQRNEARQWISGPSGQSATRPRG